jgi:hypothetical protein
LFKSPLIFLILSHRTQGKFWQWMNYIILLI